MTDGHSEHPFGDRSSDDAARHTAGVIGQCHSDVVSHLRQTRLSSHHHRRCTAVARAAICAHCNAPSTLTAAQQTPQPTQQLGLLTATRLGEAASGV